MVKIREDLIGAVHVAGHILFAGDEMPRGLKVGAHLTTGEKVGTASVKVSPADSEVEPEKPKRGRPRKKPEADDASVD